jgi:hypothetical protein
MMTPTAFVVLATMTIAVFIVLSFFPRAFLVHACICWIWGIIRIVDFGGIISIAAYLLGCVYAWRANFLTAYTRKKQFALSAVLLGAILSELRYGLSYFVENMLHDFEFALILSIAVLLVLPTVQRARASKNKESVLLGTDKFTQGDISILHDVLTGEKYEFLCTKYGMSESSFARHIKHLFNLLDVGDRTTFLSTYAGRTILLQGVDAVAPETSGSPRD